MEGAFAMVERAWTPRLRPPEDELQAAAKESDLKGLADTDIENT
jgi:hypothetical protein